MNTTGSHRPRKHFSVALIVTGIAATAVLAASVSGTLSGFTASINNTANSVASGTLLLQENQGATTCLSTAGFAIGANAGTCATINKYGGSVVAVPGTTSSSTVTLKNIGTAPASTFTLTAGACAAAANAAATPYAGTDTAGFCSKVDVTIEDDTGAATCIVPAAVGACTAPTSASTLTTLATASPVTLTTLAAGVSRTYKFTVMIDGSATNADQGLQASQSLTWLLSS